MITLLKQFLSNNKKKNTLILLFIICSCNFNKQLIEITQDKTKHQVIVLFNKEYKKIVSIELPIKISLKNNSFSKKDYTSIEYLYSDYNKGIPNPLYTEKNNKLFRVRQSRKKEIKPNELKEYVIYTRHYIDTSARVQKQFKKYTKEMISKNIDTLAIGTINNFKKKHNNLLKSITKDDRISVKIWSNKDVSIPVKF